MSTFEELPRDLQDLVFEFAAHPFQVGTRPKHYYYRNESWQPAAKWEHHIQFHGNWPYHACDYHVVAVFGDLVHLQDVQGETIVREVTTEICDDTWFVSWIVLRAPRENGNDWVLDEDGNYAFYSPEERLFTVVGLGPLAEVVDHLEE